MAWQWAVLVVLVALPLALLVDFYPHRERLDSWGVPLRRDWEPQVEPREDGADHH